MLVFLSDDAWRLETGPIAVERHRALEIVDPEGQNGDAWFHVDGLVRLKPDTASGSPDRQAGGNGGHSSPRNPPPPQYFTSWS